MNIKTNEMPTTEEQQHHYYATTGYGWAVADTRQEALAMVARQAGKDIIARQVKSPTGGLYVWSCRVDLPKSAHYTINEYYPQFLINKRTKKPTKKRVPTHKALAARLVNVRGHLLVED